VLCARLDDDIMEVLKYKHLRDGTRSVSDELARARKAKPSVAMRFPSEDNADSGGEGYFALAIE